MHEHGLPRIARLGLGLTNGPCPRNPRSTSPALQLPAHISDDATSSPRACEFARTRTRTSILLVSCCQLPTALSLPVGSHVLPLSAPAPPSPGPLFPMTLPLFCSLPIPVHSCPSVPLSLSQQYTTLSSPNPCPSYHPCHPPNRPFPSLFIQTPSPTRNVTHPPTAPVLACVFSSSCRALFLLLFPQLSIPPSLNHQKPPQDAWLVSASPPRPPDR